MISRIGKYEIREQLGKGSFGDVYLAVDSSSGREAALKVLDPVIARDTEAVKRFIREARALKDLQHPRIAGSWEMGEENGFHYIVMRYVRGRTLDQLLKEQGPLQWEEALRIFREVGEALQYAHENGYVHRDVKPDNIILSEEDGAVLTDFGIVKALSGGFEKTRTGMVMGTPEYMATEVINGLEASAASDQFSLACVLVKMLTGSSPFHAPTILAIFARHNKEMELPAEWPAGTPGCIAESLRRALHPNPLLRYACVSELIQAVINTRVTLAGIQLSQIQRDPELKPDDVLAVLPGPFDWCSIPARNGFLMKDEEDEPVGLFDVPRFGMAKYPITNAQFDVFVEDPDGYQNFQWWTMLSVSREEPCQSTFQYRNHPRTDVSWYEAVAFCRWLSIRAGIPIRLPTEWEWQWAAQGPDRRIYPWGNVFDAGKCNCNVSGFWGTTPAGQFPFGASPYGVTDMSGNVEEWCLNELREPFQTELRGKVRRGLRGASWGSRPVDLHLENRCLYHPDNSGSLYIGFRVIRPL
jgi:serine/threonine protein kinase